MRDWKSVQLKDAGTWLSGGTPFTENPRYWDGDIPWISAASLKDFRISRSDRRITELGAVSGTRLVPPGTVLFVVRGMSLKTEFRVGVTERQVAFGQDCKAIIPAPGVDAKFLALTLKARSRDILAMVDEAGHGTGRLPTDLVASLRIDIPALAEQKRITEILDSAEKRMECGKQVITKIGLASSRVVDRFLSNAAKHVGLEMLGSSDRPFLKTGPFGSSLKGEDWVDTGVPVITIGSLRDGFISQHELLYISDTKAAVLKEYRLIAGDIVFSRVADVGRSAVVTESQSGWIMSSNLMRISVDPDIVTPRYVQLSIAHYTPVREQIRRLVNGGGREVVNDAIMRKLRLPLISREDQERLLAMVDDFKEAALQEEQELAKLEILKRGLMDDLLTGRVRVSALYLGVEVFRGAEGLAAGARPFWVHRPAPLGGSAASAVRSTPS
jgi:type I restriction enzyme S subunit